MRAADSDAEPVIVRLTGLLDRGGGRADERGCFRLDPRLQDPLQARAHRVGHIACREPAASSDRSCGMARSWHSCGMPRVRVSTTVDDTLLARAREARPELNDAALLDQALQAMVTQHRAAELDAAYAAYDAIPLDAPDEWGDLASFRDAAAAS